MTMPPAQPTSDFRRIPRARLAVIALFFVNGMTVGAWVPYIPDRARILGLNPAQLGLVLLASGLGCVIAMPLAGWLTTRIGSRAVSTIAGMIFPLAMAAAVIAPSPLLMALSLLLFGIAGASMDVAMNSHGVLVEERLGRRTFSLFHGLYSMGGVAGSAFTSAAMARGSSAAWTAICTAIFLTALVFGAHLFLLPHVAEPKSTRAHMLRPKGRLLLLGILAFSAMVSEGAVADWSGLYLRLVRGLGEGVVGYGFTAFCAAMVAGRLTGDRIVAAIGEVWTIRMGALLGIAGLLMVILVPSPGAAIGGFAALGLGLANVSPVLYRAAGKLPGVASSTGIATTVGIGYAGLLAGPPILGFVGHSTGLRSIFCVLIALCALLLAASPLVRLRAR